MADFQTSADKLKIGKDKKEAADEAFKQGKTAEALMGYHGALLYLLGLDKNALGVASGNPAPPVASSSADAPKEKTEALAKDENNYKAMFRKGKALAEQGYFERAIKVLEELKKKSTNDKDLAAADAELVRLRAEDKEKEKANNKKLKGFLSRDKGKKTEGADDLIEPIQSATIEEIPDDA
ncbi:TPR-like protein [Mycena amicta]|nr:TPR-like protein [Mycena amicta]